MDQLCERPFYSGWRINRRFFFIFDGPPAGDCHGFLFPMVPARKGSAQEIRNLKSLIAESGRNFLKSWTDAFSHFLKKRWGFLYLLLPEILRGSTRHI